MVVKKDLTKIVVFPFFLFLQQKGCCCLVCSLHLAGQMLFLPKTVTRDFLPVLLLQERHFKPHIFMSGISQPAKHHDKGFLEVHEAIACHCQLLTPTPPLTGHSTAGTGLSSEEEMGGVTFLGVLVVLCLVQISSMDTFTLVPWESPNHFLSFPACIGVGSLYLLRYRALHFSLLVLLARVGVADDPEMCRVRAAGAVSSSSVVVLALLSTFPSLSYQLRGRMTK